MPTLDELRDDIDRVDEVLVRLLNERARVACEIGRIKKDMGIEGYQPEREKQVLAHVRGIAAEGPLGPDAIARLFERIIDEARSLERRILHEQESRSPSGRPEKVVQACRPARERTAGPQGLPCGERSHGCRNGRTGERGP